MKFFAFFSPPVNRRLFRMMLPFLLIAFGVFWAVIDSGFWSREFWFDEAFTGLVIQLPWQEMFQDLVLDVHPPLYYFILKLWGGVFGFTDIALRSFSIACFAGFLLCLYFLLTEEIKKPAVVAGILLFFICNPFFIQYAQEARMYMLLVFLITAAALFFLRALKLSPYRFDRNWFLFSLFLAPTLLIHYTALFAIPAFFIAGGLFLAKPQQTLSYLFTFGLALIIPAGFFALWYPFFRQQLSVTEEAAWIGSLRTEEIPVYFYSFFFGTQQSTYGHPDPRLFIMGVPPKYFGLFLGVGTLFLSRFALRETGETRRLFLFCSRIAMLLFATFLLLELFDKHLILSRYLLLALPFLLIACLLLVYRLPKPLPILFLIIYLGLTFSLVPAYNPTHYRELAGLIREKQPTYAIFTEPVDFFIARFYKTSDVEYLFTPGVSDEDFSGWVLFRNFPPLPKGAELPQGSVLVFRGDNPTGFEVGTEIGSVGELKLFEASVAGKL